LPQLFITAALRAGRKMSATVFGSGVVGAAAAARHWSMSQPAYRSPAPRLAAGEGDRNQETLASAMPLRSAPLRPLLLCVLVYW
jgi:hypothetical protein